MLSFILIIASSIPASTLDCISYDNDNDDNSVGMDIIHSPEILNTFNSIPTINCSEFINNSLCQSTPTNQFNECMNSNISECYIHCERTNCNWITWPIKVTTTNNVNSIIINCKSNRACYGLDITISDTKGFSEINEISMLCGIYTDHEFIQLPSCNDMDINIFPSNHQRIYNIYCMGSWSCQNLKITEWYTSYTLHMTVFNIYCIGSAACNNMEITYDTYHDDAFLNLFMLEGISGSIKINADSYDSVNITCGNDKDERYIKYDKTDHLLDIDGLEYATRDEYHIPYFAFPCNNIDINSVDRQCQVEYKLTDYYDFVQIITGLIQIYYIPHNVLKNTDIINII